MAISGKPKRSPAPPNSEAVIEALINRGGSPTGEREPDNPCKPPTPILLRLPTDMLHQIDAALKTRPVKIPRHTWILEAIHEKLTREAR